MSGDDWVRIIGAIAAGIVLILGALAAVFQQIRATHSLVNSRMDELLMLTRTSGHAEGMLEQQGITGHPMQTRGGHPSDVGKFPTEK